MPPDPIDALVACVDSSGVDALPAQLRSTVWLGLARELITRGELARAAKFLDLVVPTDTDLRRELATLWLLVAKSHETETETDAATSAAIEQALSRAIEVDPIRGRLAFARRLQRQRQWPEAVAAWREIIRSNPDEPHAHLSLARCYEKSGKHDQALAVYLQLTAIAPTSVSYLTVAPRLAELAPSLPDLPRTRQIRIALLGNATLDQLASYLSVECYRAELRPTIYQAGFDQATQEILDPASGLYAFQPDVVICALHASRLFPRLHHDPFELSVEERRAEVTAGLAMLEGLLTAFTQRSSAIVLVHNMVVPQHQALGILDWRDELGQSELFGEINRGLAELVRGRYRTVYVVDEERVQSRAGKLHATDPRLWLTARVSWSESVHLGLAREYVRYMKALRGLTRKCIVLDLDNTLWGGVIGEDGVDGIQLGAEAPGNAFVAFQRELERLWRRGILLAICSKNNPEDVATVLNQHPAMVLRWSHFAAHRISWEPKVASLRELAAELNIGLDSLVFLDDNPVERAAVRSELPEVLVPELPTDPAQYRSALLSLDVFESLGLTSEDRQRGQLYAQQAQRRQLEAASATTSLDEFLAALEIVVEIAPARSADLPRIAQLTNKTNQFNLTTRRYTEADLVAMDAAGADVVGMHVRDRFGDNGLVGVAILNPLQEGAREIDTLLLSCRVMGRGVESALLGFLAERARADGANRLLGRLVPTAKNAPARQCYPSHGFGLVDRGEDGSELWELDLIQHRVPVAPWLEVV